MMREYATKKNAVPEAKIQAALEDILNHRRTIRGAAEYHNVNKSTLSGRLKRLRINQDGPIEKVIPRMGLKHPEMNTTKSSRQIFSEDQERLLVDYLLKSSQINFELTLEGLRELAYDYAVSLGRNIPQSWKTNEKAGKNWGYFFLNRHRSLSLRKLKTSLAREIDFTKENMEEFYDNLRKITLEHDFNSRPERIFNIGDTGLSSVLEASKVMATKGVKQVGQLVLNECGEQVTMVGIVSAAGDTIPPVYVFPGKLIHQDCMEGCPQGAIAIFNETGCMDKTSFLTILEHIKLHSAATTENPILIVLNNHSSHSSFQAIMYCSENGIHLISFPPNTTHKTQPLHVSVFSPFKTKCKSLFNDWTASNPGQHIILHNIVRISADAVTLSFTESNIRSGFQKAGIFPFDRKSFFNELDKLAETAEPISTLGSQNFITPEQICSENEA